MPLGIGLTGEALRLTAGDPGPAGLLPPLPDALLLAADNGELLVAEDGAMLALESDNGR